MIKQIWTKELIKLNKLLLALFIMHIGVAVYYWMIINSSFKVSEAISVWQLVIERGVIFFSNFQTPILASAIAIGVMQFYPEVEKKRFRISCHLPMNENLMVISMPIFAVSVITCLWLFDVAAAYFAGRTFYPYEMYSEIPVIMFYWYVKALVLYALAAVLTLEPSWFQKIRLGIVLAATVKVVGRFSYNSDRMFILTNLVLVCIIMLTVYYPALRFREGE